MANGKGIALAAGAGLGSLFTYILTHPAEARASTPPTGMDQETWDLLIGVIQAIQEQNARLDTTLSQVVSLMGGTGYALSNPSTFVTGSVLCAVAMQGYPIPPKVIPYDKEFIVKALSTNAGLVYVANNQVDAAILTASYPMLPNEAVGLKIANADEVWVAAQFAGEGVSFIVEQK